MFLTGLSSSSAFHHPPALLFSPRLDSFFPLPRSFLPSVFASSLRVDPSAPLPPQVNRPLAASLPPQVNRAFLYNTQSISVLSQNARYTCEGPSAGNVPQRCISGLSVRCTPPQVNRVISHNSQSTSVLSQTSRYTCEEP